MSFESELKLSRRVVWIRLGDTSERRVSEAGPTAAIADVEVGRIRYIGSPDYVSRGKLPKSLRDRGYEKNQ
jgi:hypothetical protein